MANKTRNRMRGAGPWKHMRRGSSRSGRSLRRSMRDLIIGPERKRDTNQQRSSTRSGQMRKKITIVNGGTRVANGARKRNQRRERDTWRIS